MKNIIFLFLYFSLFNVFAQNDCKKRKLNDVENGIIREYISEAQRNGWYKNGIGVVEVSEDLSQYPYYQWNMSVVLDNERYLDSTTTYAYYHSDLILFKTIKYGKSYPMEKTISGCWTDIVGDRLYIKPPKQNRPYILTFDGWEDGKPILDEYKKIRQFQTEDLLV